ncbi:MAG TPA: hypothetical protein VM934_16130 [Pyrinomonadaceae bacterium]|nr:hypothetical protein [Pyrinomonadaceae bacterium]
MRSPKLLLTAGLSAYFTGAWVNFYLWPHELCSRRDARCRIVEITDNSQVALRHPFKAIEYLVAPVCS